ncbi:MAG: TRAP transporter small permease subunit, partial [Calditrichaeota bacterium]
MAIEIASTTDLLQVKAHRFNPGKYLLSGFTVFIFVALVLIPLLEALGRRVLQVGIPGASTWVQHFTLWLGLAGAILATLRGRHLSIATTGTLKSKSSLSVSKRVGSAATLGILLCLTWASIFLVKFQKDSPETIGGWFPVWLAQAAMPVAFFVMALLVLWNVSESLTGKLTILILALMFGPLLALLAPEMRHVLMTPGIITLVGLAFLGMPLYAVLGGAALLLFYSAQ